MSLKRPAVREVLCLGLLFCSTHQAQAQDYAALASEDLYEGDEYASIVYNYNPPSYYSFWAYYYAWYAEYYASNGDWYQTSWNGYYAYYYAE
jgi:hypothetical protein